MELIGQNGLIRFTTSTKTNIRANLMAELSRDTIIRLSILTLLNMADYVLTVYAITSGIAVEGNPLLASVPLAWMGIIKIAWNCLFAYFYWKRPKVIYLCIAIFYLVVIWNVGVILS